PGHDVRQPGGPAAGQGRGQEAGRGSHAGHGQQRQVAENYGDDAEAGRVAGQRPGQQPAGGSAAVQQHAEQRPAAAAGDGQRRVEQGGGPGRTGDGQAEQEQRGPGHLIGGPRDGGAGQVRTESVTAHKNKTLQ